MYKIRLIGRGNDNSEGPDRIFKDIEWLVVPDVGHDMEINPHDDPVEVEAVKHVFHESRIEVFFGAHNSTLKARVEYDGFQIG